MTLMISSWELAYCCWFEAVHTDISHQIAVPAHKHWTRGWEQSWKIFTWLSFYQKLGEGLRGLLGYPEKAGPPGLKGHQETKCEKEQKWENASKKPSLSCSCFLVHTCFHILYEEILGGACGNFQYSCFIVLRRLWGARMIINLRLSAVL